MGDPYDEAEIVNVVVDSRHSFGLVTSGSLDLRSFFFRSGSMHERTPTEIQTPPSSERM